MKMTKMIGLALLVITSAALAQGTVTAFKTGERVTGTTKQCYYSFGGSQYTRTVQAYQLCPLSIQVRL